MEFLRNNINLPPESIWYNPASEKDFFNVDNDAFPFILSGTTDVVITKQVFAKVLNMCGGVQAGFKLKKKIEKGDIPQAVGQLIVANIISQQAVFIVLTDLGETWFFYWIEEDKKSLSLVLIYYMLSTLLRIHLLELL